jgi:hypothetical protein
MAVIYFGRRDENANSKPVPTNATFNLRIRLDRAVTERTSVALNFQRLVNAGDVQIETRAISDAAETYFTAGGFPPTVSFAPGEREKTIGPIRVRSNATAGGNRIVFPDDLFLTAFVPGDSNFAHHISHVVTLVPQGMLDAADVYDEKESETLEHADRR